MAWIFNITPIGKPRMVRSDSWTGRKCVAKYWQYKEELNYAARELNYELKKKLNIIFYLPMPESWSKKKKLKMNGKAHDSKPDCDNLLKAFMDCLLENDSKVYDVRIRKYWDYKGSIKVI